MPVCSKCGKMQASVEMRKLPKGELYVCKDKPACKRRTQRP